MINEVIVIYTNQFVFVGDYCGCKSKNPLFESITSVQQLIQFIKQVMVRQCNNSSPLLMLLPQHVLVIRPSSCGIE
jgi:hypothetical protein